jgi:hypothetical protein
LILEGVLSIAAGMNQQLIQLKLEAYLGPKPSLRPEEQGAKPAAQPAQAGG